ncbi:MAG: CPBP family intramembrane metalloprotease [Saprospiraceae bacterium]|nr:CPBP family intramembrane metalloprotease [Saprospiraceae bacterium]
MELYWYDHLLFFITAVMIPALSLMSRPLPENLPEDMILPPKKHLYYQNGLMLIIGSALVITAWNAAERPWAMLGFQLINLNTVVILSASILVIFYIADLIYSYYDNEGTEKKLEELSHILPMNMQDYKHYIFLAFAAGICEEIIFRGFLIRYLELLLGSYEYVSIVAILIPAFTFGLSHMYQGYRSVLKIVLIAVLFGIIFVWSGSLILAMIIHISIDLISGLSGVVFRKEKN